jgi:O-antigen ligase
MPSLTEFPATAALSVARAEPLRFERQDVSSKGLSVSYWLLLTFLFLLYLNVPIVLPALEVIHPAKLVGGAALITLFFEITFGGQRLKLGLPQSGFLMAFLCVAAMSCLTALWPRHAAEAVADLVKMVLVFFFIVNCATTERRLRGVMWTMVIGGLIPTVAVIRNYLHGNLVENRTSWVGIFANPNDLAYSLVILVPIAGFLAIRYGWLIRVLLCGVCLFYAIAIFVTFSRGGLIGLAVVVGLFAWAQRSALLKGLFLAMILVAVLVAGRFWSRGEGFSNLNGDTTFLERFATDRAGVAMFLDHPLLGVGPACSVVGWEMYAPRDISTRGALVTHNTFVQALSETGAPGFLAFVMLIGSALHRARTLARRASTIALRHVGAALEIALWGFCVCGLSNGNMLTWFPYVLVGLVAAAARVAEETPTHVVSQSRVTLIERKQWSFTPQGTGLCAE